MELHSATPPNTQHARNHRLPVFAATLVVAVVAFVGAAWVLGRPAEDDRRVLVRSGDGTISLLDPETGTVLFNVPNAVATPDRSALLTTRPSGANTVLESRDPSTGIVTGSTTVPGALTVRTVSPRGGAVALMPGAAGDGIYDPQPRTSTELTVAFLDEREQLRFTLDGNIEPEMFSLDETTLFVLEFVPPMDPTSYHVKKLDLATGEVTDTAPIQVDLTPAMRGTARAQVLDPRGTYLHTLYTLPSDAPVFEGEESDVDAERWAFVHVISLDEQWSACIFLPIPFGITNEASVGMTVSPDGKTVYVADPSISQIAEIDVENLTVVEVHDVELLRESGARAVLAVADDGTVYVAAGHLIIELAPHTFEAVFGWRQQVVVTGLAVSGGELRVAGGGEVVLVDRETRLETGVISSPDHGTLELLGPPRGSVTEFPLECAC
jgi:DNA-binding beta-propeller fold protein YncE